MADVLDYLVKPSSDVTLPSCFAEIEVNDADAMLAVMSLFRETMDAHWHQDPRRLALADKGLQLFAICSGDRCDAYALVRQRRLPLIGKTMHFVERGPVYRTEAAAIDLIKHLLDHTSRTACMIEVNPFGSLDAGKALKEALAAMGFLQGDAIREHYHDTVVLELDQPIELIRKGFRRSLKTQINRFDRQGLTIAYRQDVNSLDLFCEMVNNMAEERGLKPVDKVEKDWIQDQLGQSMHLFIAELDSVFKGGILLISTPTKNRIVYEYGGSIDESAPPLPVGHGLHWHAIQWAKQAGYQRYDFGGYDRGRGDKFSINQFKLGFSKTIEPLMPELRWMPSAWLRFGLERYLSWQAAKTG